MQVSPKYRVFQNGRWTLLCVSERWSPGLWARILEILKDQAPASHPRTTRFNYPEGKSGQEFYLKVHFNSGSLDRVKDLFRVSKAFRALKQGEALSQNGFRVPSVVAAGERRAYRYLERAFVLSLGVKGSTLPMFLRDNFPAPLDVASLKRKREYLTRLATEIRRFHGLGFVHGDLTPYNIFVESAGCSVTFAFMDNDRTRRYPGWVPQGLWKRNLVQLNRFILPGITLQDRMRFLRAYLGELRNKRERRLIRWLERNTRKRWLERNELASQVSFRELLRWNGPFSKRS